MRVVGVAAVNDLLLPLLNEIRPWPCRVRLVELDGRSAGDVVFLRSTVLMIQMHDDEIWVYAEDVDGCDELYDYCDPLLIDKLRALAWRSFGLSCLTCM